MKPRLRAWKNSTPERQTWAGGMQAQEKAGVAVGASTRVQCG